MSDLDAFGATKRHVAHQEEVERLERERDEALEKVDSVTDHAVAILSGACDKHADLSFAEFVEAGGDGCAICIKAERDQARAQRDALREAQEACRAWQGVYETLEAHLMDRVAMQDPASPETYLSILRSSVARVERASEQILAGRYTQYAEVSRQRDAAEADRDYWKNELLSEQADYDKARAERDALKEALIRASQRLGDLGAHVLEPSRRTIAEVVADISQALAGSGEA